MRRRDLMAGLAALPALDGKLKAGSAASEPGPDLGNLHPVLQSIAGSGTPRMSFLSGRWKSLEAWKETARPFFRERLSYSPEPEPLGASAVSRESREGFTLETVKIRATAAYDIPACVLVPARRAGRVPGIVAIHCHGGAYLWGRSKIIDHPDDSTALNEYRQRAYRRAYPELLARAGYVVVVIDAFYFGERRLRPEDINPVDAPDYFRAPLEALTRLESGSPAWYQAVNRLCGDYEHLTAKTIFASGATWPGLLVWDDMRAVDYLCSRPEVDSGRIGCVGLSIGGLRAAHLIGADPRIKAACVTGWMTVFHQQLRNHLRHHTWMAYVPGLYRHLDLPDVAALTAPGALLVQQCQRDILYPPAAMRAATDQLARIYARAGIGERFRGSFYDVPHSFGPPMQDEAFEWLAKWL